MSLKAFKYLLNNKIISSSLAYLGIIGYVLSKYWKATNITFRNQITKTGIVPVPRTVYLETTLRCNLNCIHCHQKGRREQNTPEMTTEQLCIVLNKIHNANIKNVEISGGEMFLRKDIFTILEYAITCGLSIKITSNGTLITNEIVNKLQNLKINGYATSIDGSPYTHNKIRGKETAYYSTIYSLDSLQNVKYGRAVCFVLMEQNIDCIEFVFAKAKELGINRLIFSIEMFVCEEDKLKSENKIGATVFINTKPKSIDYANKMIFAINTIKLLRKKYGVFASIYPFLAEKNPETFLNNKLTPPLYCTGFEILNIMANGEVWACQFIRKSIGNILTQSVDEIWNSEAAREMRKKILDCDTMLPICSSCCRVNQCAPTTKVVDF